MVLTFCYLFENDSDPGVIIHACRDEEGSQFKAILDNIVRPPPNIERKLNLEQLENCLNLPYSLTL